ncbi:MAG: L-serine ammonia-lyase, iron-sulfur-dependent subunit beta [Eubacteriales bacterium]|nr:L-serine ammonia-lyase, iron-sulfur-dependent subunit beta [Eubacteriales bacterium]
MNVFDIIGPIMIGPSSSHTAGAARLGRTALKILGEKANYALIEFSGSFAKTYKGHGTDKAIIAGILGFHSYDERIKDSLSIAKNNNLNYEIKTVQIPDTHPNTARMTLKGENSECIVTGASIGGGNILITNINGLDVHFSGDHTTILVIHKDKAGAIAEVTNYIAKANVNICGFNLGRNKKGGMALMTIEVDSEIPDSIIQDFYKIESVIKVVLIKKL